MKVSLLDVLCTSPQLKSTKSSSLVLVLASTASALVLPRATPSATVTPFLAPLCELSGIATNLVCHFPQQTLTEGQCVDVTYKCKFLTSFQTCVHGGGGLHMFQSPYSSAASLFHI